MAQPKIKAVFFDFMGTCLDWHTGAVNILPSSIQHETRSTLALDWRKDYFKSNTARLGAKLPPEDIDITLYDTLTALLATDEYSSLQPHFTPETITACVAQWHFMPAWPEVRAAIEGIQALGLETFVFANGTTRLQLDLCKSSGLSFDMLFSSALLGVYKPALESYVKVLDLVKVKPEETVMVAAHIDDLRGATRAGMKTIYIKRWTDDVDDDVEGVKKEVDFFLGDMDGLVDVVKGLA